ncbi:MAG: hypothetical protein EBR09_16835, partial [Proteobacteria bacterium]|nr:hypothetical protein [Pseudomonadota bacterium]
MKMFVNSKHLTVWLSTAAAASVLVSCKGYQDPSKILAVEVGNPGDKPRPKENKPIPMQLIHVTLETNSLDEISKVEFTLDSVKLSLNGQSQSNLTADAENAKQGSTLLLLPQTLRDRVLPHTVSFATGALLATAFVALMPHAVEGAGPGRVHTIGLALLGGIALFFVLEKFLLWRH